MKTIIAGSRNFFNYNKVVEIIRQSGFEITQVVSGGAPGVDTLGERWAGEDNYIRFPAHWDKYGNAAGPIRNQQMANYADALIAIYDSRTSKGTRDMIEKAKKAGLKIYTHDLASNFSNTAKKIIAYMQQVQRPVIYYELMHISKTQLNRALMELKLAQRLDEVHQRECIYLRLKI